MAKISEIRAEAIRQGKKTYIGSPCKHHPDMRERLVSNNNCLLCSKENSRRRHKGEPPKDKPGRPSVMTDELTMQLCQMVAAGNFIETACMFAGVRPCTVREWMFKGARAENENDPYAVFAAALKKAEAQAEIQGVMRIRKASEESWQAMAWWLERARKPRWSQHVQVDIKQISDEELAELILTGLNSGGSAEEHGVPGGG